MEIESFIKSIRGLSQNTKTAYEQTLWQVRGAIKGQEPTDEEILTFLSKYTTSSLHRHKAAIKAYLEFKKRPWPFNRRQFRARRRSIPRYIQPAKVEEMIGLSKDQEEVMFVKTLFNLGCRISELLGMRRDDISESGVRLKTKGGYEKLRPITQEFYKELEQHSAKKKGKIFPKPYNFYYKSLKALGKKVGREDISPHMLRHARAVDLLRKGMNLPFVQQFLGHANINTTAIYLEITGGELGEQLEKVETK